jgi:hypothetical protein
MLLSVLMYNVRMRTDVHNARIHTNTHAWAHACVRTYTYRRNTGMASGKFLERMKLYKPGTSGTKLKYYVQSDFYINATVVAQVRFFVIPHSKCIFKA